MPEYYHPPNSNSDTAAYALKSLVLCRKQPFLENFNFQSGYDEVDKDKNRRWRADGEAATVTANPTVLECTPNVEQDEEPPTKKRKTTANEKATKADANLERAKKAEAELRALRQIVADLQEKDDESVDSNSDFEEITIPKKAPCKSTHLPYLLSHKAHAVALVDECHSKVARILKYTATAEMENVGDVVQSNSATIQLGLNLFNICDGKEVETLLKKCHQGKKPWDTKTPEEVRRLLQEAEAEAVNSRNERLEMAARSLAPISRFLLQLHQDDKAVDSDLSRIMGEIYQIATAKSGPFGPTALYIPIAQQALKTSLNLRKEIDGLKEQFKSLRGQRRCLNCTKNKVVPPPNHSLAEC